MFIRILICCSLLLLTAWGKRLAPKPVVPVVSQGIQYSTAGTSVQYVVASDVATLKELWRVEVFRIHIKPWQEEDNQLVFITHLDLEDGTLSIKDEKSRCYTLEFATRLVKKERCK